MFKKNSLRFAQMRQWKKNYNFVISSLTICDRLFTMYSNYVNQTEKMDFFFFLSFFVNHHLLNEFRFFFFLYRIFYF